jgi:FMN phosphatase YigB (HAD superfamily)
VTTTFPPAEPQTLVNDNLRRWIPWDIDANQPLPVYDVMFDIDDVLFPTIDSIHELARQAGYHNGDVEPCWSGWEAYDIEPELYWDLWSQFAASEGYVRTPPIKEAARALRSLAWAGHRVHLVTARGFMAHAKEIRAWTQEWVASYAIPWDTLTFAQDKVAAQQQIATELGDDGNPPWEWSFDYAIDDRNKTIEALRAVGVDAYLLTHSHNREDHSDHRVGSVPEFVDLILEASA